MAFCTININYTLMFNSYVINNMIVAIIFTFTAFKFFHNRSLSFIG